MDPELQKTVEELAAAIEVVLNPFTPQEQRRQAHEVQIRLVPYIIAHPNRYRLSACHCTSHCRKSQYARSSCSYNERISRLFALHIAFGNSAH